MSRSRSGAVAPVGVATRRSPCRVVVRKYAFFDKACSEFGTQELKNVGVTNRLPQDFMFGARPDMSSILLKDVGKRCLAILSDNAQSVGGNPGEEESQEGEEDALCAALSCPGHAASLLVVLLLVLGFVLLRFGVLAVLERLVGHAGDVPEMAHLQSNVSAGA